MSEKKNTKDNLKNSNILKKKKPKMIFISD